MERIFLIIKVLTVTLVAVFFVFYGKKVGFIISTPEEQLAMEKRIALAKGEGEFGRRILGVGETYLEMPISATKTPSTDSMTNELFIQNCLAVALTSTTPKGNYGLYVDLMEKLPQLQIRHFQNWLIQLENKRIVHNLSEYYGGVKHKRGYYFIDIENISEYRDKFLDGDMVVQLDGDLVPYEICILKKAENAVQSLRAVNEMVELDTEDIIERFSSTGVKGVVLLRFYKGDMEQ